MSDRAARHKSLYFTLAFALRRSAQYCFRRKETALRAAADTPSQLVWGAPRLVVTNT